MNDVYVCMHDLYVCMCVCVFVCIYVSIHVFIHTHTYIRQCTHTYTHTHVHVSYTFSLAWTRAQRRTAGLPHTCAYTFHTCIQIPHKHILFRVIRPATNEFIKAEKDEISRHFQVSPRRQRLWHIAQLLFCNYALVNM